jgi:hypothetical protein
MAPAADQKPLLRERPVWAASLVTRLKPGETVTWRSHRIGTITAVSLVANGADMAYQLKPRTNACVGYAYGEGVAVRLTDCVQGRRVPYVRVRAVNAGVQPARLRLRFGGGASTRRR